MRYALLIGVAYVHTEYSLPGCLNDIARISKYVGSQRFDRVDIMHDELSLSSPNYPSRNNVLIKIYRAVRSMTARDQLWIHFSGHGFYVGSGNETISTTSGNSISTTSNECILLRNAEQKTLADIDETNTLCDEQMIRIFDHLPEAATVLVTVDACHSGSMFDLRYNMQVLAGSSTRAEFVLHEQHSRELHKNVAIFTATNKEKYAWDVEHKDGLSYGIFTTYLMDLLEQVKSEGKTLSYMELLFLLHKRLQTRENKQDPRLSISYKEMAERMVWL